VATPVLVLWHPEVYIAILPAMGLCSQLVSVFSRKPILVTSDGVRDVIHWHHGFMVWGHHIYERYEPVFGFAFSVMTMAIGVPSAIKTFNG